MNRLGKIGIVFLASASLWACGSSQATEGAAAAAEAVKKAGYDTPVKLDVAFQFLKDDDIPELDVFVESSSGGDQVQRLNKGVRDMSTPLYALAEAKSADRDPFDPEKMGPFPKGKSLGITAGDYYNAKGIGTYTCTDGTGKLDIQFSSLVPNSLYTIWHSFYPWPPTKPFLSYDMPLGARDGSESLFRTDDAGSATFNLEFKPCLQLGGEYLTSDLSLAWHSDGEAYGASPGEFSTVTHVQMYFPLPKRSGI